MMNHYLNPSTRVEALLRQCDALEAELRETLTLDRLLAAQAQMNDDNSRDAEKRRTAGCRAIEGGPLNRRVPIPICGLLRTSCPRSHAGTLARMPRGLA